MLHSASFCDHFEHFAATCPERPFVDHVARDTRGEAGTWSLRSNFIRGIKRLPVAFRPA